MLKKILMLSVLIIHTHIKCKQKITQRIRGGDGYNQYIDCSDGKMGICICPKCVQFFVYQLYLSKA